MSDHGAAAAILEALQARGAMLPTDQQFLDTARKNRDAATE
jgi:hypothetical protein